MIERPKSKQPIPKHAKLVFEGQLFHIYQWEQELFDGSKTIFERAKRVTDSAIIVPVLPDGRFIIERDEQPGRETVITFPGGQIEAGEDPEQAALRELSEETGYMSDRLEYWFGYNIPGKVDHAIYFFIAHDCVKTTDTHQDAGERITTRLVSFDELLDISREPNFQNLELIPLLTEARYNEQARKELLSKFV